VPAQCRVRAGFTLVEVVLAATLFAVLFSSAILAARGGAGAFRATQGQSDVEVRARRALDRVVLELMSTGGSTLLATPLSDSGAPESDFGAFDFQFRQAIGVNGTAPLWGPTVSLAHEYAPEEADDGVDNDGNGLIDDGVLALTRDVGGTPHRVILCRGVRELLDGESADGDDDNGNGVIDEGGFNVHRVGDVLFVRLSLEEPVEGGTLVRTLETALRLRND
jgi:prepilin-type N-terminal cleavage/methylation domain-containing protein